MAQDAELKLKVSLDLSYFRQRLAQLSTELGGQSLQLNIQFNKKSIDDQYRLLGRHLEAKTFKVKVESPTLDVLVKKVSTFKKNLAALGDEKIDLAVNVVSNIDEVRKSIKSKLPSVGIDTKLNEPVNVDDFIREVGKKVKGQVEKSYAGGGIPIATKLETPGTTSLIKALQKNFNNQDPLRAKVSTTPSIQKSDVTAFQAAVNEKFKNITVKVKAELETVSAAVVQAPGVGAVQQGATGKRPSFLDSPAYQAELQKIAKANAQVLAKAAATLPSGRNREEVERLLQAFQAQNPQGASRSSALGAIRELIARGRYQQGLGFEASLQPIRGQRQTSAARSMPNLNQMLDRIANLTENPRAAQRMLRMMPESRLTTDLVGAANRQAAFREQYGPQGFRLPGFGGAKAFDPLLKSIAESFSDYTRTVNTSNPWMGKIGSGITTLISRALTQSPEQMFGGRAPVAGAKLLPAAGQTSGTRLMREQLERANLPLLQAPSVGQENAPLSRAATYMLNRARRALELPIGPYSPYEPNPFAGRATVPSRQYFTPTMQAALPPVGATGGRLSLLEQQLAQSRGALGTGGGVAGSLFTGRALINPGISMLSPVGISGNYRQMAAALANQAANPALAHRQIADIGFGGVPTAATGMSGEALNRALNQAFLQRRGLGIGGGQSLPIFNAPGVAVQQNIPGMAYQMGGGGLGGSMGTFPSAGMMGPSSPLTINAQSSMFGGGGAMPPGGGGGGAGGMGGMGGFGRALGGVNLPGAGAIRELGQEFAFATQQVLLFGQAYKMLAFIQNFPTQVGAAVSQLQNFRNTLGAISPTAEEAASSNRLILDLVEKYNVPLQSARDGFTKLYASMAPAGFSGDEIRNLFTGITQAAATFGMSADKVDRVNYAFAQMASKGQVMSEELKGQLGDVLPGAMAIFAKAAGFEGSKAIQDFSAELEAGRYKGEAMVALLKNVGIVMRQEFGSGAEGAALTFQGIINRMQNSMTLLYESFEPVAVGFLNTVVVPLTDGIRQISDGFNAFFTGAATKTSGGFGIAQELERLKPTFEGFGQNVKALIEQFGQFARAGLEVGKVLLQIAGNPFVGYLGRVYLGVLALTTAIQILNLRALIPMIANFARSAYALITFTAQCVRAGQAVQITGLMLRTFFATTGVGIVLLGIGLLIEKFMSMNQALADTRAKALGAADAIRSMSQTEARAAEQSAQSAYKTIGAIAGRAGEKIQGPGGDRIIEISERELKQLQGVGAFQAAKDPLTGRITARRSDILSLAPQAQRLQAQAAGQIRDLRFQEQQAQQQTTLPPIPAGGGDEKGNEKALRDVEQLAKQEQQRRIELAGLQNDMDKISFDYRMSLSDTQFEHEKRLIDELNNYELSGLNDMQARQLKFAQDLKKVRLDAEDAIRKAIQKTEAAQLNVVSAQRTAQAAGGGGEANSGPIIGGFTPAQLSSATAAASKFTGIANMCSESVKAFYKSLGISLPGVTAWADTVRNAGTTMKDWSKLAPGDIVATGKPGDTPHVGVYTGGQNVFHQSRSRGLRAGNYPDLDYFKQGGYFVRPSAGIKQSSASFSMDTKAQKESFDLIKEQAKASAQTALQQLEIQNALKIAYVQTASTIKANIDNIFPVEKQKLDLSLQQMRHNLLMQGMPQEYIDYEEKRAAATEEAVMAVNVMKDSLNGAKAELKVYNDAVAGGTKLSVDQQANVARLTGSIAALEEGLANATKQQREYNIASLESAIATMKQADALKAMEEVSGRINDAVTGVTDTYKSLFKEIAMGEDSVEALKKAQKALADQFLTMVFDMAMKPVEESMKNSLAKMFGVPTEKEKREESIKKMEEQLTQLKLIENNTAIAAGKAPASGAVPTPAVPGQMTAAGTSGGFLTGTAALQTLPFNGQTGGMLQNLPFPAGDTGFLSAIGINGEELSASISESANAYSEQLSKVDTSVFESANALGTAGTELGKEGAAGKKWHESLGQAVGGLGMAAGAVMGIVAGINQIKEGGTSNVLGGIGMIASMAGSLLGNFGGLFGGGGGASSIVQGTDIPIAQMPAGMQFANGGVAFGGFRAFANGGTVSGPTLGLVGEGKYNEAIVPLPDGRSIPVQLGGRSARDLMGNGAPGMPQAPSLSMKFETTKINGVEYVSREQLEQAMAETRRASIAGGAQRGMSMTLDKIKQSPSTRSSIGIR